MFEVGEDDTALSFLPLCHGFERMVAYTYLANGVSMIFAESIDTIVRETCGWSADDDVGRAAGLREAPREGSGHGN